MEYRYIVHEVVRHFGRASLRRWPLTALEDVELSTYSRSFLSEVGLPAVVDMFSPLPVEFSGLPELPMIENKRLRRIGDGNYLFFAVESGREENPVFAVADDFSKIQFVNSSVWQLSFFLKEYDRFILSGKAASVPAREQNVAKMIEEMTRVDSAALRESDDCIWSVQIEMLLDFGIF